ncbi:hypothetical protein ASPTUDRAFT_409612 [Aspergillus tubingensis CBS 134.48]|uniref:Uncharacterized protein n=1 Tax=Aspergillus tubingensis (strain CBS 134.48) TaxID=767770 RepID=A0A1L9NG67_ASPTC|nr:hypothetical protein ASPTUDRAFT_409612 [Aspergillus tubingensis CBS 134.48]
MPSNLPARLFNSCSFSTPDPATEHSDHTGRIEKQEKKYAEGKPAQIWRMNDGRTRRMTGSEQSSPEQVSSSPALRPPSMPSPPSQGSRDVAPYPLAASFHTPPSLRRLRDFLPESDGPYKKNFRLYFPPDVTSYDTPRTFDRN